jgi:hypothetical protein
MKKHRTIAIALVVMAAGVTPVFGQGGYVGAALVGDIARFDQFDTSGRDSSGSGEALGFGLRLGTELGTKWGVELEFVRPSEITNDISPDFLPLLAQSRSFSFIEPSLPTSISGTIPTIFPPISSSIRTRQRNTTLSAGLWMRQEISPRFSLAYIGGVSFGRTSREIEVKYEPIRPIGPIAVAPIILPPVVTESTTYGVGPMVGLEGRIGLTEHVQIVPGVRLHAIEGGWLIRPSVGLDWAF